jgi:hypothetical protein
MTVGQVIIVEGKADTNSSPPKILVDSVRTEIKILEPLETAPLSKPAGESIFDIDLPLSSGKSQSTDENYKSTQPGPPALQNNVPVRPTPPAPRQAAEKPAAVYAAKPPVEVTWDDVDIPPPPENFPDHWETQWQPSFEEAIIAARPEPKAEPQPARSPHPPVPAVNEQQPESKERDQTGITRETMAIQTMRVEFPQVPASLYVPLAKEEKDKDHPPRQITVVLRSTGDKDHDRRRIKTIYGTLISFHGRDRFSFQIYENGSGYLIDFPNDTTRVCPEVLERLKKLMGEESWRVEEITFQ